MPMDAIAVPALPSVGPMVSHESYSALADTVMKAGATPPTLVPKGAPSWYAAGAFIGRAMLPHSA